jgi:hypothetical protein
MEGLKVGKLAAARPWPESSRDSSFRVFPHQPEIDISMVRLFSLAQPCISIPFLVGERLVGLSEIT